MVEWGNQWQTSQPPDPNEPNTFKGIIVKGGHYMDNGQHKKYSTLPVTGVSDGTSNTIAIAEKAVSNRQYQPKVWDWWEDPGWAHNADWPNMRLAGNWVPIMPDSQWPRIDWTNNANGANWFWEPGFGSAHPGVFMAVFGDGSVRGIRMTVGNSGNSGYSDSTSVLYRLGKRDDGRKLQKITDQHHLDAAEWFRHVARNAQAAVNDIEQVAPHHRYLVNDETGDLAEQLATARAG